MSFEKVQVHLQIQKMGQYKVTLHQLWAQKYWYNLPILKCGYPVYPYLIILRIKMVNIQHETTTCINKELSLSVWTKITEDHEYQKTKQKHRKTYMVTDKTENVQKITFSFMHKNKFLYRKINKSYIYHSKKSTKMKRAISIEI